MQPFYRFIIRRPWFMLSLVLLITWGAATSPNGCSQRDLDTRLNGSGRK